MPGIYIHIPYCKKACTYCDFHFSTSTLSKPALIDAICTEVRMQQDFFTKATDDSKALIQTVYFGGGTPSILQPEELEKIFKELYKNFNISPDAEITLEANPDDLSIEKIKELKSSPVNRLSIGVQSFRDSDLKWMNRSHTSEEAIQAIDNCINAGFTNLNADLIYGIPGLSAEDWKENLKQMFSLGITHLSAYCLTVEKGTLLHKQVKKGQVIPTADEAVVQQFETLLEYSRKNGFIQYEISNFSKEGLHSKHNSSYWTGEPYLGLGPSAHSYDGKSRFMNIANNPRYINLVNENGNWFETEVLSYAERLNEMILLGIRTMKGCNLSQINHNFGSEIADMVRLSAETYIQDRHLFINDKNCLVLTDSGKMLADKITSDLFIDDEDPVWQITKSEA